MRAVLYRLAAMWLAAVLAGPGAGPCPSDPSRETGAASAQDPGMNAPPGPAASAALSVAPMSPAAPLSPAARVISTFSPVTSAQAADRVTRPAVVVRSAPAILRL